MYEYLRQFLWIFRHVHMRVWVRIRVRVRVRVLMSVYICETPEQDEGTTPFVVLWHYYGNFTTWWCAWLFAYLVTLVSYRYLAQIKQFIHNCRRHRHSLQLVWKSICVVILTVHFLHCHYMLTNTHAHTHCSVHNKSVDCLRLAKFDLCIFPYDLFH